MIAPFTILGMLTTVQETGGFAAHVEDVWKAFHPDVPFDRALPVNFLMSIRIHDLDFVRHGRKVYVVKKK